ncbi:MAG: ImmA/IrrE family metallo-endopeptidase [Chloroflexi bacterium]|nr:ImmA/IrrE family metallo-endopeptidase [Chloroflexota bacterium]
MKPLDSFTNLLWQKYGSPPGLSPEMVAEEWVAHSRLSALPSLSEIHSQLQSYGLSVRQSAIPGLRGHHYCYRGGDPTIFYEDADWRGTVEFTLLHEFYEVILDRWGSLLSHYEAPPRSEACWRANKFAAAVLMQKDIFLQALYESHFDIVWLHRHFYRSYSAIAIRAVQLLNEATNSRRKELACAIYHRHGDPKRWPAGGPADFHVGCAMYTSGLRLGRRGYPGHLMPKKGDKVLPGSIVELALQTGQPVLLKRATGFDSSGEKDLTFLARPVLWFNQPSKLVLTGMKVADGHLLEAQARELHPRVIAESYQLI